MTPNMERALASVLRTTPNREAAAVFKDYDEARAVTFAYKKYCGSDVDCVPVPSEEGTYLVRCVEFVYADQVICGWISFINNRRSENGTLQDR